MFDIIFFVIITIYFIFKLKNSFGEKNDNNLDRSKTIEEFFKKKYGENTKIKIIECKNVQNIEDIKNMVKPAKQKQNTEFNFDFEIDDKVRKVLENINFNQKKFLLGVEKAIEMVNEAFSNNDEETLRNLLTTKIFINFQKQINNLKKENKSLKSSVISFVSKKIEDIKLTEKNILIKVYVKMEQINYIVNDKNEVIAGSKKKLGIIEEKWTFKRLAEFENNFWIVEDIENV